MPHQTDDEPAHRKGTDKNYRLAVPTDITNTCFYHSIAWNAKGGQGGKWVRLVRNSGAEGAVFSAEALPDLAAYGSSISNDSTFINYSKKYCRIFALFTVLIPLSLKSTVVFRTKLQCFYRLLQYTL